MSAGNFGSISDKLHLGYGPAYYRIAADLGPGARVCEVGVYHGDSLRLWQQLFPYGEVTGVDNDPAAVWPDGTRRVIADVRDPGLAGILGGPFDLVVDDGCHLGSVARKTFDDLWPLVAPGGYYVIEDWYVALPEYPVYGSYDGNSMLETVASLLCLLTGNLGGREAEADEVRYQYGLAVVHRRNDGRP